MEEKEILKQRILAGEFAQNNGAVMRVINILAEDWKRLELLKDALTEMKPEEFAESISFLQKAGYIEIRECYDGKKRVDACDANYKTCEVGLTAQGIRLSKGFITDPAVRM